MPRLSAAIVLIALTAVANAKSFNNGICRICFCTSMLFPHWTLVNCTNPITSSLNITENDIPNNALEVHIEGVNEVVFNEAAFTGSMDLRTVTIVNTKKVLFREYAAVQLSAVNFLIKVYDCGSLNFEKSAFVELGGPIMLMIQNCNSMAIDGVAFSWILKMEISNVRQLTVRSGSFTSEHRAPNVSDHGPGLTIELTNVTIPEIPKSAFGSSAARLYMESVDVPVIRTGAFSANTYNVVIAINCSLRLIEDEAFSEKSLINYLNLDGCKIQQLKSQAVRSAIALIEITNSSFDNIESGAINSTVASVQILDSVFHEFMENGFLFSSLNSIQMERCTFDDLPPNAIATPGASIHELIFNENEIETVHDDSLAFIGKAIKTHSIIYVKNYYGHPCKCNISEWIAKVLGVEDGERFVKDSFCTVNDLIAKCFNVKDQNMLAQKFLDKVCIDKAEIKCEQYKSSSGWGVTNIHNPRFPHRNTPVKGLSDRNKKVIGIVIVTCLGCLLLALFISLIRWLNRRGYCFTFKNFFMSANAACCKWCARVFNCGNSSGVDTARSISQISVNEYSERYCLNDYRGQDTITESSFQGAVLDPETTEPSAPIPSIERSTQTLPQELTEELIDNLRKKIEVPHKYSEAKQMIHHLYDILKIGKPAPPTAEENIYEIPFTKTTNITVPSKDKKVKVSVGTKVPSLEKLLPLSPYCRETSLAHEYYAPMDLAMHLYQTALTHEYLDPADLATHLYDEVVANDKEKKILSTPMPDVIGEQPVPRGPYLQKVLSHPSSPTTTEKEKSDMSSKSITAIKSAKMKNRPLPKKPVVDPGEGTSTKHG